jgi:thioredoxin-like negative regulator of GroEL
MGQSKKKSESMPRQEVNFCCPSGWVQERICAKPVLVCFDAQWSMETPKLAPAIATRLDREVKFAIQAGRQLT